MVSMTRKQAHARLQDIHAQMFILGEEAKALAGYLNGAAAEDEEFQRLEVQAKEEAERLQESQSALIPAEDVEPMGTMGTIRQKE